MATFVWSGAQDTNWFNANNWNPAIVPGASATIVIPIGLARYPVIPNGAGAAIGHSLSNHGTITLASTGNLTDLVFTGGVTIQLTGAGTIALSDSPNNRIYANQSSTILDNVDNTISGAGQIFSNSGLSIINEAAGVINGSGVSNALNITSITITNAGLVEATASGGLVLGSMTLDQSSGGALKAAGGDVSVYNTIIKGGSLQTSGGSVIHTVGGGTLLDGSGVLPVSITAGSTVQVDDGTNLAIVGIINDVGRILLNSGADGIHFGIADLIVTGGGTVKLNGGGTVQMSDSPNNRIYSNQSGTTLENVDDSITGAGQIFSNSGLTLQNDAAGVVNANAAANALSVSSITVNNAGLVEATASGGLALSSMTLDQSSGGALKAAGGDVSVYNTTIKGGSLQTSGGSVIQTVGAGTLLDGSGASPVSISSGSLVRVNDGTNLAVIGVISNAGRILLNSGSDGVHFDAADLIVNSGATVKLQGGGTVQMSDSPNSRIYSNQSGTTLENVNNGITGAGQIFSNAGLTLQNDAAGIVNANAVTNALSISSITVNNAELIEATASGGLALSSMVLDQSGGGTLAAVGGNIGFNNSVIKGGTLKTTGTSVIQTNGGGTILDGTGALPVAILSGSKVNDTDGQNLMLTGAIANSGVINLLSGQDGVHYDNTDLYINGTTTLNGGGIVSLSSSPNNRIFSATGAATLDNINNTISGAGQIFSNSGLTITNEAAGVISASSFFNSLVVTNIAIANKGLMQATASGSLVLGGGSNITQTGIGAVRANGGNVLINNDTISGGTLSSLGYYSIQTNASGALINGAGTAVAITAGSNVRVNDGSNLSLTGTINNAGTISLNSGSDGIHFDNTDLLINGTTTLNGGGTVLLSNSPNNRIFSFQGGSKLINGNNTIIGGGSIFSNGALSLQNNAGGVIEASLGQTLTVGMGFANAGLLEANGGTLDLQGAVTGVGSGMVANGGTLKFDSTASLSAITYAGPNAGNVILPSSFTPTINEFAAGDKLTLGYSLAGATITTSFVEDASNTFGTLTVNETPSGGGAPTALESFRLNGFYTNSGFLGFNTGSAVGVTGVGDVWNGSALAWGTAAAWSQGLPGAKTDAVVNSGAPALSGAGAMGAIRSFSVGAGATVNFAGSTGNTVTNMVYDAGVFALDNVAGQGGSQVTTGSVTVAPGGLLSLGNATLSANDKLTTGSITNLGAITLTGSAANQALINDTGAAGFGAASVLSGSVTLSGSSAIAFASGTISTIAAGGSLSLTGVNAFIENAALNSNSALTGLANVVGALHLENGASVAPAGPLYVTGSLGLDEVSGAGGTSLTLTALRNNGSVTLGSATLSGAATLNAASLTNTGSLNLIGNGANQALLSVTSAANFAGPGVLAGQVTLAGNSAMKFASGQVSTIASGASLDEKGNKAFVELATLLNTNSALSGLSNVAGALTLENGATVASTAATGVSISGTVTLDGVAGEGGAKLTTTQGLQNQGTLSIGNSTLSSADLVQAARLANTGAITLAGSASFQARLNISGAAGFGTLGVLTGAVSLSGKSAITFGSGAIATIAAGSSLTLSGPNAFIALNAAPGSNSALTSLSNVNGTLSLSSSAQIATSAPLNVTGLLAVDPTAGDGGTIVATTSGLTNSGTITLGNGSLSASDKIQAASLTNSGSITLAGNAGNQALLNILGGAGFGTTGILTGSVLLAGNSAIEFLSGQVTTVAAGASLTLQGASAFIENAGGLGSNSALATLATVSGQMALHNSAIVSSSHAIAISAGAGLGVDAASGDGGSQLTTTGLLTNAGTLTIGNVALSSAASVTAGSLNNMGGSLSLVGGGVNQALLDVTSGVAGFGAAGSVLGAVSLFSDSAVEFVSGSISSVVAGASLTMNGSTAFIEDSAALGSNSALSGLATVNGTLSLLNSASISSTHAIANAGAISLDAPSGGGGSQLVSTGALTNSGSLSIGNTGQVSNDLVQGATLSNTGSITLNGGSGSTLLNLTAGVGFGPVGTLSGTVFIGQNSAVELSSTAAITTIAAGSSLELGATTAFLEDAGALASNSALKKLSNISGVLTMDFASAIASTLALTVNGSLNIDTTSGQGGGSLSTAGALTNKGTLAMGSNGLTASASIAAASLKNTGALTLTGAGSSQAVIKVTSGAAGFGTAGSLTGQVTLNGNSAIQFAGGAITTIATGALLRLNGSNAFVTSGASPSQLSSNSALTTLSSIVGQFDLENFASLAVQNSFSVSGGLFLDSLAGEGGSTLSSTGTITNSGTLNFGNTSNNAGTQVSSAQLVNTGFINLTGNGFNSFGQLSVSGAVTNNGTVNLISDSETLAGAVGGTGTIDLFNGSTLTLLGVVGSGQTITYDNPGALNLAQAPSFQGTIAGFGAGDTIDALNFAWGAGDLWQFVDNGSGTGGSLELFQGGPTPTATLTLSGSYTTGSFNVTQDSAHTGALVTFV